MGTRRLVPEFSLVRYTVSENRQSLGACRFTKTQEGTLPKGRNGILVPLQSNKESVFLFQLAPLGAGWGKKQNATICEAATKGKGQKTKASTFSYLRNLQISYIFTECRPRINAYIPKTTLSQYS